VTEGVVVVRQGGKEARVAAGESWPSGCGEAVATGAAPAPLSPAASAPLASASSIAASAPAPSVALAAARPSGGVAASTSAGSPASTLGAENDLITLALDARKRERYEEALSLCERYLATYPSGAHVDDARDIAKTARERIAHAAPSESASPKP
jgi:TolA-binding protein